MKYNSFSFLFFFIITNISGMQTDLVNIKNTFTWTPLHAAISAGCLKSVQTLVDERKADIEATTNQGKTPLILAAEWKREDIAEFLLQRGAKIDSTDSEGAGPLHYACKTGSEMLIQYLILKNVSYLVPDHHQKTAIHYALEYKNFSDPTSLLALQSALQKKEKDTVSLHWACQQGLTSAIEEMIINGARVDEIDKSGNSPLHYAASHSNPEILRTVLAALDQKNQADNQKIESEQNNFSPISVSHLILDESKS